MKKILYIFSLLFLMLMTAVTGLCADIDTENLGDSVGEELFSAIDGDIAQALEEIGVSRDNFTDVYDISFSNISAFFSKTLKEKVKECLSNVLILLGVVVVFSLVAVLFDTGRSSDFVSLMSSVVIALLTVNIIKSGISSVLSVLKLSAGFMASFVPVYTLLISLAGNTASALTYNTLVMGFAQGISAFLSLGAVDLMGMFFCLSVSFSMNSAVDLNRFISIVNKSVSLILGLIASLFTGFLSVKNILSAGIDSVSVRSMRFLISSLIPIVGSSISDAYSSLLGSINLIKGSVAVIGILVILIINLPIILETLIYYAGLSCIGYAAESLGSPRTAGTLRCFSCGVRILLLLCVFEMFLLIISTGIMLSVKGGA